LQERNINNIVWKKGDDKKWYVPAPDAAVRKTPGTAGYCYFTYDGTFN
jgi:hypothetical protein